MTYSPLTFKPTADGYLVGSDLFTPLYRVVRQRDGRLLCGCPDSEFGEEGHVCKHAVKTKVIEFMAEWWRGYYQQRVDANMAKRRRTSECVPFWEAVSAPPT